MCCLARRGKHSPTLRCWRVVQTDLIVSILVASLIPEKTEIQNLRRVKGDIFLTSYRMQLRSIAVHLPMEKEEHYTLGYEMMVILKEYLH